jgi:hypothetical protein
MKPRRLTDITQKSFAPLRNVRPPAGCNRVESTIPHMKTKIILVSVLLSAGLATSALAAQGRGNGGSGRNVTRPAVPCDPSGPGQGTPLRDGSGKAINNRGNPNSTGTPLRDGSGKATAPGKGPKDGTGNNANCPNPPKS